MYPMNQLRLHVHSCQQQLSTASSDEEDFIPPFSRVGPTGGPGECSQSCAVESEV